MKKIHAFLIQILFINLFSIAFAQEIAPLTVSSGSGSGTGTTPESCRDELSVDYSALQDAPKASKYVLNKNLEVGTTAGSWDVTPTGAAVYSIPIFCPPGTEGVQPNISVNYNSQSGNGILGKGWSLGGVSSIVRVPKTIYHDDVVSPVSLTNEDRFAWDGNRLILLEGSNGNNGALYKTENETFAIIRSIGNYNGGPSSFIVETKDGWTYDYGGENATVVPGYISGKGAYMWLIKKATDPYGNYIEYVYSDSRHSGEKILDKIRYTGNEKTSPKIYPYNEIRFFYKYRTNLCGWNKDYELAYVGGGEINQSVLLDSISVRTGNNLVKGYKFRYVFDEYSHLIKIEESAADGTKINPTIIEWNPSATEKATPAYIQVGSSADHMGFTGDFNGDGKTDIVILKSGGTIGNDKIYRWELHLQGAFSQTFSLKASGNITGVEFGKVTVTDIDGDGKDDIIFVESLKDLVISTKKKYVLSWYRSTENGFSIQNDTLHINSSSGFYYDLNFVDLDGDGEKELFMINPFFGRYSIYKYANGNLFGNLIKEQYFPVESYRLMDFDGDGAIELMTISQYESKVYKFNGTDFREIYAGNFPTKNEYILCGDFNGDGKADIISYNMSSMNNKWKYHLGTGSGFVYYENINVGLGFSPNDTASVASYRPPIVADFNGDGKDDILVIYRNNVHNYYNINLLMNRGLNDFKSIELVQNYSTGDVREQQMVPKLCDFNGDGRIDVFFGNRASNNYTVLQVLKDENKHMVKAVVNGMGLLTEFSYARMNNFTSGIYTKGNSNNYPVREVYIPLYLVNSVKTPNGKGWYNRTSYKYENARMHLQGKGFLGFEKVTVKDESRSMESTTNYEYHPNFYNVYPIYVFSKINTHEVLSMTDYLYTTISLDNGKRYFSYPKKTITIDYFSDIKTEQENLFDENGNLTKQINKNFAGVTSTQAEYEDTRFTGYRNFIDKPYYYRPKSDTLVMKKGSAQEKKIVNYRYYDGGGFTMQNTRLSSVKMNDEDPNLATTTTYSYAYNNGLTITQTTASTRNPNLKTTTVTQYERNNRWPVSITENGLETQYEYEPGFGNLTTQLSVDGLLTQYKYDYWGKRWKTIYPDNTEMTETVWWVINVGRAVYYKKVNPDFDTYITTFYDELGREVRSYTRDDHDKNIFLTKEYNWYGQLIADSVLHNDSKFGTPKQWTEYQYDAYGRITQQTVKNKYDNSIMENISYTYDKRKTTVRDLIKGDYSIKETDSKGNVTASTDATGTVTYTYYPSGRLKTTAAHGLTTTLTYDKAGNKIAIHEPNTGTTSYQYNALGQLTKQTHANGTYSTFEYDQAGRIIRKQNGTTGSVVYSYYASGIGKKGKIDSIKTPDCVTTFTYNDKGQTVMVKERIDNMDFKTEYTYDLMGKLKSTSYPSLSGTRFEIMYLYHSMKYGANDGKGGLHKIALKNDPAKILWENARDEQFGNLSGHKKYVAGNGWHIWVDYDQFNRTTKITSGPVRRRTPMDLYSLPISTQNISSYGNVPEKNPIFTPESYTLFGDYPYLFTSKKQEWSYGYNEKSLMEYRADRITQQEELFTYDGFQRLTAVKQRINGTEITAATFTYMPNGNMTYKSDAGSMYYEVYGRPNILSDLDITYNTNRLYHENDTNRCETEYTPFHKIKKIKQGNYTLEFTYGTDEQRIRTILKKNGTPVKTKYFIGGVYEYEINHTDGSRRELSHFYAEYMAGIHVKDSRAAKDSMYYVFTDHLGSFDRIANENGLLVDEQSFDAWGNRRNPRNWQQHEPANTKHLFDRGYTGHEHLEQFKIINMNGRLYDPVIARFFSADPYVQAPDFTQNFNRYSYAWNNPLSYTDPSGEWFLSLFCPPLVVLDMALWSATIDVGFQLATNGGEFKQINWAQTAGAFVSGLISGGMLSGAPAINNISHLGLRYLAKGGYAGLTAGLSSLGGSVVSTMLSPGGFENVDAGKMFGNVGIAALSAFGLSAISSLYQYATWDRLSYEEKISKLQKKGFDINLGEERIDKSTEKIAYGYSDGRTAYVTPHGLDHLTYSEIKSISTHELFHGRSRGWVHSVTSGQGEDIRKAFSEATAYRYQYLNGMKGTSLNFRKGVFSNMNYYRNQLINRNLPMGDPVKFRTNIFQLLLNLY